jgi:hypothetical protein
MIDALLPLRRPPVNARSKCHACKTRVGPFMLTPMAGGINGRVLVLRGEPKGQFVS